MAKDKVKGIFINVDNRAQVDMLTDEEAGVLFKAVFAYVDDGKEIETNNRSLAIVFSVFRTQIDNAAEKYAIKCERNREIALEGWRVKKELDANVCERMRTQTNVHEHTQTYANAANINKNKIKIKEKENNNIEVANATIRVREAKIDYDAILVFFNEEIERNNSSISKIKKMTDKRKRLLKARLAANSLDDLKLVIHKAATSDFMNGRCRGNWVADFDWLIQSEENFTKVLEATYDNKELVKSINTSDYGTSRRDIEEIRRRDEAAALVSRLIAENE